jgi:hypothetical protein
MPEGFERALGVRLCDVLQSERITHKENPHPYPPFQSWSKRVHLAASLRRFSPTWVMP